MDDAEQSMAHESLLADAFEESLEDLYHEAPCGYLSTLDDGTVVKVNRTFLRWLGYEHDEIVRRKRFYEMLAPGDRIFYETHFAPMLRMQGFVREIAVELVRADGRRLPALLSSVLRPEADGRPAFVRTTIFDATERRSYEQELLLERTRAQESEARLRYLAQTLQESLIPLEPSQIPGFEVAASYRPAGSGEMLGGDFYDVFETKRGDWIVVLGDVTGKGAEAARVTAAARYTLRAAAMRTSLPSALVAAVNEALAAQDVDRYCTLVCARIVEGRDRFEMTVCSAGHPLPLLLRKGATLEIGEPGTLLGAFDDPSLSDTDIVLDPGTTAVFYTDGIIEARRTDGEMYGEERLSALVRRQEGRSAGEVVGAIMEDVLEFQGPHASDDVAVLVLRRASVERHAAG